MSTEKMSIRSYTAGLLLLLILQAPCLAEGAATPQSDRLAWWREARFGMFIHWGIYSLLESGEWVMHSRRMTVGEYEPLARRFNPVHFDPAEWVSLAKRAGMRYIVFTAKHHDGFCMFDSSLTDYDIMSTPYGKDVLKELAAECHRQRMPLGIYYSIMDWHHPDYLPLRPWDGRPAETADYERYIEYVKGQLRELLTNYGPVAVLWFDGGWEHTPEENHAAELVALARTLQPGIIINDRLGVGGDFATPEQYVPAVLLAGPWETCMTNNHSWGYNAHDTGHKSTDELIALLCETAGKGGNLLLNVGPRPDGTIQPEHRERLIQMGRWLRENGEAIYGTGRGPFRHLAWGACTASDTTLYALICRPPRREVLLPGLLTDPTEVMLLGATGRPPVRWERRGEDVALVFAEPLTCQAAVRLVFSGPPQVLPPTVQQSDGPVRLEAAWAVVHGSRARYEEAAPGKGNIGYWTDPGDWVEWHFRIGRPGVYRVTLEYACEPHTAGARFAVEVAGQTLTGAVRSTGSWRDFVWQDLGTVRLERTGRYVLKVRCLEMPGYAVMNLAGVVLEPTDKPAESHQSTGNR